MKELSIEEKAKAYDEAIERAKNFIENGDERERTIAESIFAGIMEESEDERIRKALIRFHKSTIDVDGIKGEDIIAWLEKQGEQKPAEWSDKDENIRQWITSDIDKLLALKKKSYIIADKEIDWLKSLKDRHTWNPSDEQMKQLGWIAKQNKDNMIGKELMSLYQDLKKLNIKSYGRKNSIG